MSFGDEHRHCSGCCSSRLFVFASGTARSSRPPRRTTRSDSRSAPRRRAIARTAGMSCGRMARPWHRSAGAPRRPRRRRRSVASSACRSVTGPFELRPVRTSVPTRRIDRGLPSTVRHLPVLSKFSSAEPDRIHQLVARRAHAGSRGAAPSADAARSPSPAPRPFRGSSPRRAAALAAAHRARSRAPTCRG